MIMRRHFEPPVWLLIVGLIYCGPNYSLAASFENKTTHVGSNRPRVFSPRIDYDEWTPLGRGNPLRNDPTYDYVPPVLDRVQYWLDSHTTEPTSKRDILLLGATAKKTSPKLPDQYFKFANRPKFANNQDPQTTYKNNFTNNPSPDSVNLRTTSFRNDVLDYRNQNRIVPIPGGYYSNSNSYYGQQSKPYTMMLPPPLVPNPVGDHSHLMYDHSSKDQAYENSYQFSTQTETGPLLQSDQRVYDYPPKTYSQPHPQQVLPRLPQSQATSKPTSQGNLGSHIETLKSFSPGSQNHKPESTTSTVSFEKSDLVYQSSQTLSGGWLVNDRRPAIQTVAVSSNQDHYYQEIDHQAAASSNQEVAIGQNANIIVQGESCGNGEVVIGQKEAAPSLPEFNGVGSTVAGSAEKEGDAEDIGGLGSSSNMHIVLANLPISETTDAAVALVMPTNYVEKKEETRLQKEKTVQVPPNGSEMPEVVETEKPGQEVKHLKNDTSRPSMQFYLEDQPTLPPLRDAMAFQQPPTRFTPSRVFGGTTIQQMVHHPGIQGQPVQGMMHYGSNLHGGMAMDLRPPAPPVIGNRPTNMADLHRRQQPNSMLNVEDQNQARPPYQHQISQSLGTTMTSAGSLQTMSSVGMNAFNEDQGVFQTDHRRTEAVQTTLGPTPTGPSDAESVSPAVEEKNQSQLAILLKDEDTRKKNSTYGSTSTTSTPIPITTVSSLTTDQIFSHYKQPAKPIRGPMYLIIQGHSKVKTYKPTVESHGNSMEDNEILDNTTIRPISKFEKFVNDENTKRIAEKLAVTKKTEEKREPEEHSRGQDSLLSLLESGFGAFAMPPLVDLEEDNSNSTTN